MRDLPLDERGYPVPWFVAFIKGKPDFRVMDPVKYKRAISEQRCWVCGAHLGVWKVFTIGPMCAINRTTSEPPSHLDCARWSARNCPFLSRPHMVRRENDMPEGIEGCIGGMMIKRNPGVTLLWVTKSFETWRDPKGGPLIEVGPPESLEWWAEGKHATREQVEHSIETGLPALREIAATQDGAMELLDKRVVEMKEWYPL
jgi:hypothetical protein